MARKLTSLMRFSTIATTFLLALVVVAQAPTPNSESLVVDTSKRDLSLLSIVSSAISLGGEIVPELLGLINFESIAGFADELLAGDNVKFLDDVLIAVKDTGLVPEVALFLVTHNSTYPIVQSVLTETLKVAENVNTTDLWVALDKSGLAYLVVAGALEDPATFPAVLNIVKKFISSGALNLDAILLGAESLLSNLKREYVAPNDFQALRALKKRDNIESLLETIFESVGRSGLLNDTIHTLLVNPQFQDAAAVLLEGAFQNLGSTIGSLGSTAIALEPVISSLFQSGLLQGVVEQAFSDPTLLPALEANLASLLKLGILKREDLLDTRLVEIVSSGGASLVRSSVALPAAMGAVALMVL